MATPRPDAHHCPQSIFRDIGKRTYFARDSHSERERIFGNSRGEFTSLTLPARWSAAGSSSAAYTRAKVQSVKTKAENIPERIMSEATLAGGGGGDKEKNVHEGLGTVLAKFDVNAYAASVKVFAVKGG